MRRSLLLAVTVPLTVVLGIAVASSPADAKHRPPSTTTTKPGGTTTTTAQPSTTTSTPTTTTTLPPTTTTTAPAGACTIFPADNPWNTDISNAPVLPNSAAYIANILANGG